MKANQYFTSCTKSKQEEQKLTQMNINRIKQEIEVDNNQTSNFEQLFDEKQYQTLDQLKCNIRQRLSLLFVVGISFGEMLKYLKFFKHCFSINYNQELIITLNQVIQQKNIKFDDIDQDMFNSILALSDQELIVLILALIDEQIYEGLTLNQLKSLQLLEQEIQNINQKDLTTQNSKIFSILKQLIVKNQSKLLNIDIKEYAKDFELLIIVLLSLMAQKDKSIPDILEFIYFDQSRQDFPQIMIETNLQTITKMFEFTEVNQCLKLLHLDQSIIFQYKYNLIEQNCKSEYPHLLSKSLSEALVDYVDSLRLSQFKNKDQYITIFEIKLKSLMDKLWILCGENICNIIQEIVHEQILYSKQNTNLLKIGVLLYSIQIQVLKKNRTFEFQEGETKEKIVNELEKRNFAQSEQKLNPLFKPFITKLVDDQIPYPLLLKLFKMDLYNLKIGYRLKDARELIQEPRFKQYLQDKFQIFCDKQYPDDNLSRILQKQYNPPKCQGGKKYQKNWPQLIYEQLVLIENNKEYLTTELFDAFKHPEFSKVKNQLKKLQDNNGLKMKTKDILITLDNYLEAIKK